MRKTSRLIRGVRERNQKLIIVLKAALSFYVLLFGMNYLIGGTKAHFNNASVTNITITALEEWDDSMTDTESKESNEDLSEEEITNTEKVEDSAENEAEEEYMDHQENNNERQEPNQREFAENNDVTTVEETVDEVEEAGANETLENQETENLDVSN